MSQCTNALEVAPALTLTLTLALALALSLTAPHPRPQLRLRPRYASAQMASASVTSTTDQHEKDMAALRSQEEELRVRGDGARRRTDKLIAQLNHMRSEVPFPILTLTLTSILAFKP